MEAQGKFLAYNVAAELLRRDAAGGRASSAPASPTAPRSSRRWRAPTFTGHIMPYGPTKFVNGQNMGAAPVNTQVQNGDIKVIFPEAFADAKPVFPGPPV